jgi:regulatory protein YycI of two-component signal transduction system YycFG
MDWSRAKTILILAFLSLNVILSYQLWVSRLDPSNFAAGTPGVAEELDRLLQSKNIRLQGEIPKEVPKLKGFTVQFDEKYRSGLTVKLAEPFKWSAVPAKSPNRELFLRQYIDKADAYQADPITSSDTVHTFMQMHGPYPIFDIKLELIEENGEITAYRQAYVDILPSDEQSKDQVEQKIIPAHTAVRSLAETYLPYGTVIIDVRLGYHGQIYDSPTQFMLPSWRIATANGDLYYFNAINGTVVAPQKEKSE